MKMKDRLLIALGIIALSSGISFAQLPDGQWKWLIGVWDGSASHRTVDRDTRRMEFKVDGDGTIAWRVVGSGKYRTILDSGPAEKWDFEASGTVTRISDRFVEFAGKIDEHTRPERVGKAFNCSFRRFQDQLLGVCIGSHHTSYRVSATKVQ